MGDWEYKMNLKELITELRTGVVSVVFEKVDGSLREMTCTLSEDVVPPTTTSNKNRKTSTKVLAVWDTERSGWRSFRLDKIKTIQVLGEEHAYIG